MRFRRAFTTLVWALLGAVLLAPAGASGQPNPAPGPPPRFEYSHDASVVVLRYAQLVTAIEDDDPGSSLRVFGDGRVAVHFPDYMHRAGDYTLQLRRAELNDLLRSVLSRGLVDFEEPRMRGRKREVDRQSDLFVETFDAVTTELEVNLESYAQAGSAGRGPKAHKRVAWRALRADAKRYPQIPEIQNLAAIERELLLLMQRPDLVKAP